MDLSSVDLNLLKVFEQLYLERSVTRAAKKLSIAQSSLSSALKRLRELFDDELFIRSPSGMQPTKRAIEVASSIQESLNGARRAIFSHKTFDPRKSNRTFIVGGCDLSTFKILPKLIRHLKEVAPNIRLEMRPFLQEELISNIDSSRIDFGISAGTSFPKRIYSKLLFTEKVVVLSRANHPKLKEKRRITLKEYSELQHIYITANSDRENYTDSILRKTSYKRNIYLKVQSFLVAPYIIENSDLIATMSEVVARQCSKGANIQTYPFPKKVPESIFSLIWGKASDTDIETLWLINEIIDMEFKN